MTAGPYYEVGEYSKIEDVSKDDGETPKCKGGTWKIIDYGYINDRPPMLILIIWWQTNAVGT